jgi:uncharacterized protein (TIGR03086 family)
VTSDDDVAVLGRALEQLAALLDGVTGAAMTGGTPCEGWTVQDLVDHVVAAPASFASMVRGEPVDWSQPTPSAGPDPAAAFRSSADDLLAAWRDRDAAQGPPLDWVCAELAVHTWDLATATGRSTGDLDQDVAERGLAFLRPNLTDDRRSPAFGPEQPAPEGAYAYQRAAAFAGRSA